jgi:hypothetical protein
MRRVFRVFRALGDSIHRSFAEQNFQEKGFPAIAFAALRGTRLMDGIAARDVLRDLLEDANPPPQHGIVFGSPAVVVYSTSSFYIELLYWTDGTTAIHKHGFSGAFRVLAGSSVHTEYRFDCHQAVSSRLLLGDLQLKTSELLRAGDTRKISSQDLIHSLFHLESPSVTAVVRTRSDGLAGPRYTYEPPYLAADPFYEDALGARRREALDVLVRTKDRSRRVVFASFIRSGDFHACHDALRAAHGEPALFNRLLPVARRRHGAIVDYLPPVFAEASRRAKISLQRRTVIDPEHRFFVALLMNLADRREILRHVSARFRGDPVRTIMRWMEELGRARFANPRQGIGLRLSDAESMVFSEMLRGRRLPEIVRRLRAMYGSSELTRGGRAVARLHEALRSNPMYRPLFADPRAG